jgi:hypothetical protein
MPNEITSVIETVGGRKAAACLIGLAVLTATFFVKGAIPDQLLDAVKYLVTTYLAGNVVSDVVSGISDTAQAKATNPAPVAVVAAPSYDDSAILKRLSDVESGLTIQNTTIQNIVAHLQQPKS